MKVAFIEQDFSKLDEKLKLGFESYYDCYFCKKYLESDLSEAKGIFLTSKESVMIDLNYYRFCDHICFNCWILSKNMVISNINFVVKDKEG